MNNLPPDFEDQAKAPQATIRIGPNVFQLNRDEFEAWEQSIAAEVGFSRDALVKEIRRRLGL